MGFRPAPVLVCVGLTGALLATTAAESLARPDRLVSRSRDGGTPNCNSGGAAISGTGRYVAFSSCATDIVGADSNSSTDVFRRDMRTGRTILVSRNSRGRQGNDDSSLRDMSNDGKIVVFSSWARNMPRALSSNPSLYWRNLATGKTVRIGPSWTPAAISPDGRYIIGGDHLYDRKTRKTRRVTRGAYAPDISADARFMVFRKQHGRGSAPALYQIYRKNLRTGKKVVVSKTNRGRLGNANSGHGSLWPPSISSSGRYIVFGSEATNLARRDDDDYTDVYLRDVKRSRTVWVSRTGPLSGTKEEYLDFRNPTVSGDGKMVAYEGEGPAGWRVFLNPLRWDAIYQVSGDRTAERGRVSNNGRFVAYDDYLGTYTVRRWGPLR